MTNSYEWALTTSPLSWPDAAERLAFGGGWAGLTVRDFQMASINSTAIARPATGEVRVINVVRHSPADRVGIRVGDVVLAINGDPVTAASQIERVILTRPNSEARFRIRRGPEEKIIALTSTKRATALAGPDLSRALQTRLAAITRQFVDGTSDQRKLASGQL